MEYPRKPSLCNDGRRTSRCSRRGRHHGIPRHYVSSAGPAAELDRSATGGGVRVGINCRLRSAPVADLRRWIADPDYDLQVSPRHTLDLRKDWDVLSQLLAAGRGRRVLRFLGEGGREVPGRDSGLDPPRVLWPAAVWELRAGLARLTAAEVGRRAASAVADLPRGEPHADLGELPILVGLVRQLRSFIGEAAAAGYGIVVSYS
jgi:hypothetical protein